MSIGVADLPGSTLAQISGSQIIVDINAAGHGWFIDTTPLFDSEYTSSSGVLVASHASSIGRIDLLSVLMHELGHALGYAHGDLDIMDDLFDVGIRRQL